MLGAPEPTTEMLHWRRVTVPLGLEECLDGNGGVASVCGAFGGMVKPCDAAPEGGRYSGYIQRHRDNR
jgi:hypothetical protein